MPDLEQEIFDQASAAEPPAEAPVADPATPDPAAALAASPDRDEQGRFRAKAEAAASQPATATDPAPAQPQTQADHRIPIAELLRERDERQAAQRERDESRRQAQALAQQLEDMRRPKPAPRPDPWQDPGAFAEHIAREQVTPIQQNQDAIVDRFSRLMASEKFGEDKVNAAFAALEAEVRSNPSARYEAQRIWQQPHPYGALVQWFSNQSALKEIGSDPAAYRTKLLTDAMKDPEHRKAVMAAIEAEARGASPAGAAATRPTNVTRLPPSLTRAASAAPVNSAGGGDEAISDRDLYRFAAGKG